MELFYTPSTSYLLWLAVSREYARPAILPYMPNAPYLAWNMPAVRCDGHARFHWDNCHRFLCLHVHSRKKNSIKQIPKSVKLLIIVNKWSLPADGGSNNVNAKRNIVYSILKRWNEKETVKFLRLGEILAIEETCNGTSSPDHQTNSPLFLWAP